MQLNEVRSYKLRVKTSKAFHKIMPELSAPMLKKRGTDVVAFGVSLLEEDAYILILAYSELSDLEQRQGESYRSEEWHGGSGVEAVERIEIPLNTIVWLSDSSVDDLQFFKKGAFNKWQAIPSQLGAGCIGPYSQHQRGSDRV
ncbi:hypothetical protein BH11PSE12_BH11PSE12_33430 [soil metagenome]